MAKTISIIDDDLAILDVVTLLLQDEGYNVLAYSKPSEFLKEFREKLPDAVLLDNTIGVTSGKDLAEEVKKHLRIPVLMISASADIISHPCIDEFIKKPFTIDLLLDRVKKHLK